MPRILRESENNLPFHTPVYKWKKQVVEPQPSHIAATLGPRPGNTLKPPPNNFYLTKWTAMEERSILLTESKPDEFKFFSVEKQVEEEPEVIAGINLNEITKKPGKNDGEAGSGSPVKLVASPQKSAPVSPQKPSTAGSAPTSHNKPVSPQKVAQSSKDLPMHPASPMKSVSPKKA